MERDLPLTVQQNKTWNIQHRNKAVLEKHASIVDNQANVSVNAPREIKLANLLVQMNQLHQMIKLVSLRYMPQKWNLSSSVKCIFGEKSTTRILLKQWIVSNADCDAQCNQKFWIAIIGRI